MSDLPTYEELAAAFLIPLKGYSSWPVTWCYDSGYSCNVCGAFECGGIYAGEGENAIDVRTENGDYQVHPDRHEPDCLVVRLARARQGL